MKFVAKASTFTLRKKGAVSAVALIILLGLSPPSGAGSENDWTGIGVLVDTAAHEVAVNEETGHGIYSGVSDGLVFNDAGDPFLDRARYQVHWVLDTEGMVAGGYKTFTTSDQDKVFARYAITEMGDALKGTWEFTGGTGNFEGIKGSGQFTYTTIAEGVGYDVLQGKYTLD